MPVCLACYGDRVAALLDTATELLFYRAEPGGAPKRGERLLLPQGVGQAGLYGLLRLLKERGSPVLLCGGVTCCQQEALRAAGLRVEAWVAGNADEVALAWYSDRLHERAMPGCGRGRSGRNRRNGGCAGRGHGGGNMRNKGASEMADVILAVTCDGTELTDMVDPRFGRAAGFVLVNLATGAASHLDNGASQVLSQGAGIQAAENVARAGATVVLSGFVGPKAFQALDAAGIQVVQNVEGMTVGEAVDRYRRGELAAASAPNARPGGGAA